MPDFGMKKEKKNLEQEDHTTLGSLDACIFAALCTSINIIPI
jgi:hypothetical protein